MTGTQTHSVERTEDELEHNDETDEGRLCVEPKASVHVTLLKEEAEQVQADENVQLQWKGNTSSATDTSM